MEAVASPFAVWESFYVIIGSASAALTGLQFVVIVLSAEMNALGSNSITRTFATPTIVHFCAALFISAILSAPWPVLSSAGIVLGVSGVVRFVYAVMVVRQVLRQTDYVPVLVDWIWHGALPIIAYAALLNGCAISPGSAWRIPVRAWWNCAAAAVYRNPQLLGFSSLYRDAAPAAA